MGPYDLFCCLLLMLNRFAFTKKETEYKRYESDNAAKPERIVAANCKATSDFRRSLRIACSA